MGQLLVLKRQASWGTGRGAPAVKHQDGPPVRMDWRSSGSAGGIFFPFFCPAKGARFAEFNLSFGRTDLKTGLGVAVWI